MFPPRYVPGDTTTVVSSGVCTPTPRLAISVVVTPIYEALVRVPVKAMARPAGKAGADSMSPERYWLVTSVARVGLGDWGGGAGDGDRQATRVRLDLASNGPKRLEQIGVRALMELPVARESRRRRAQGGMGEKQAQGYAAHAQIENHIGGERHRWRRQAR